MPRQLSNIYNTVLDYFNRNWDKTKIVLPNQTGFNPPLPYIKVRLDLQNNEYLSVGPNPIVKCNALLSLDIHIQKDSGEGEGIELKDRVVQIFKVNPITKLEDDGFRVSFMPIDNAVSGESRYGSHQLGIDIPFYSYYR